MRFKLFGLVAADLVKKKQIENVIIMLISMQINV